MTRKVDVALEMLLAGEPLDKVFGKASRPAFYEAVKNYVPIMKERIKRAREEANRLDKNQLERQRELNEIEAEIASKRKEVEELDSQINQKNLELKNINEELRIKETVIGDLNQSLEQLQGRGVSEEVFQRISQIDFGTGDELIKRLDSFEAHVKLEKDTAKLREELAHLQVEKEKVEEELNNLLLQLSAERNSLDEARRQAWTFQEALVTVQDFLQDGYDTDTLKGLRRALNALGIKDEPKASVKRLLDGLMMVKEISRLESTKKRITTELEKTEAEVERTKSILRALESNVVQRIQNATEKAVQHLNEVYNEANKKINRLEKVHEQNLNQHTEKQTSQLDNFRENAESSIQHMGNVWTGALNTLYTDLSNTLTNYRQEVTKWGEIKQELGKNEEAMKYGNILLGILKIPEAINEIPLKHYHPTHG